MLFVVFPRVFLFLSCGGGVGGLALFVCSVGLLFLAYFGLASFRGSLAGLILLIVTVSYSQQGQLKFAVVSRLRTTTV